MGVKELMDMVHTFAKAEETDRKKRDLEIRDSPRRKNLAKSKVLTSIPGRKVGQSLIISPKSLHRFELFRK